MLLLCEVAIKLALQLPGKASWFTAENECQRDLCVIDSGIVERGTKSQKPHCKQRMLKWLWHSMTATDEVLHVMRGKMSVDGWTPLQYA